MKILHLTLKKRWYDMIESGVKTTEYRELKPYWFSRLTWWAFLSKDGKMPDAFIEGALEFQKPSNFRHFDAVQFKLGYQRNAPTMLFKIEGIDIGPAVPEWSDNWPGNVFRIKLGERLTPTTPESKTNQQPIK